MVIDDRLPFFTDGRLVFAHNKQQPDEFWASLLVSYNKIGFYCKFCHNKKQDMIKSSPLIIFFLSQANKYGCNFTF